MRRSLISAIEPASCLAINASKRWCRKRKVAGIAQNCSARTVSWAARPLAVGSRAVEHGMNTENTLPSGRVGFTELHLECNSSPGRLAVSSARQSAFPRRSACVAGLPNASRVQALSAAQEPNAQCCSRPCGVPQRQSRRSGAGAGEYARAKWRLSASAARMRHALVAGI